MHKRIYVYVYISLYKVVTSIVIYISSITLHASIKEQGFPCNPITPCKPKLGLENSE